MTTNSGVSISPKTPLPTRNGKPKKLVVTPPKPRPSPQATVAETVIERQQRKLLGEAYPKIAGLQKSLRRWRVAGVLAIATLLAIAYFHASTWINGSAKTTSAVATPEAVAAVPVGSNDKNVANPETPKAPAPNSAKSTFVSADKKVSLEIKSSGACLKVVGHILNDDEFAVVGIDLESKDPFRIGTEFLNKRTLSAGTWSPISTVGTGLIVEIRRVGAKEPVCQKTIPSARLTPSLSQGKGF